MAIAIGLNTVIIRSTTPITLVGTEPTFGNIYQTYSQSPKNKSNTIIITTKKTNPTNPTKK